LFEKAAGELSCALYSKTKSLLSTAPASQSNAVETDTLFTLTLILICAFVN
jgi:hypothetical protein